jgi:glycosyltransferase involved in cell wall biosynthesis
VECRSIIIVMKVAIYTISKNEEKCVKRWYESSREADYHILADTGSTDNTVELARSLGITVVPIWVSPFRFDDARNASLALVPEDVDYCIALDVDEVLTPGWKDALAKAHALGIDRPTYRRIEAFKEDGSVDTEFNGFKVHRRSGIRWRYPIHEVPHWYEEREEKSEFIEGFEIHHHQNKETSRKQYLPLLEMAVRELPDARNLYYLGREQSYYQQWDKAKETLKKYLEISIFPQEKAAACRILAKADPENAEEWFTRGTEEWACRESILALANHYYMTKQWEECHLVAKKSLDFNTKPVEFLAESWAWGHMAYDLIAVSAWQLNDFTTALEYGQKAVEISPDDERLRKNLEFYRSKVNGYNI